MYRKFREAEMSFSAQVKDEIVKHIGTSRHCQLAELAALLHYSGEYFAQGDRRGLVFTSENEQVMRKYFTLLLKTFNMDFVSIGEEICSGKEFILSDSAKVEKILSACKMKPDEQASSLRIPVNGLLIKNSCCMRAFLRGAFLCIGSMSDPEKSYHMEFACEAETQAKQLRDILAEFDVDARMIPRKKHFIVYIKEGASIVDILNIIEAPLALMNMENLRIVKEVRNTVNRRVNCEAANITKTVTAASRQIEDIKLIKEQYGLQNLPANLREMAEVRLEYPEAALKELGELLDPPVGKSGVNHRLRKLGELADTLRP